MLKFSDNFVNFWYSNSNNDTSYRRDLDLAQEIDLIWERLNSFSGIDPHDKMSGLGVPYAHTNMTAKDWQEYYCSEKEARKRRVDKLTNHHRNAHRDWYDYVNKDSSFVDWFISEYMYAANQVPYYFWLGKEA